MPPPTDGVFPSIGIVPPMRMRAWISTSRWGRAVGLTLLVLFVIVCGLHFAGAHHDGGGEDLGLAEGFSVLSLLAMIMAAVARLGLSVHLSASPEVAVPTAPPRSRWGDLSSLSAREIPLRR